MHHKIAYHIHKNSNRKIMTQDYYRILGVSREATVREVKVAYRRQALKYHPDKNRRPSAEKHFKEIVQAYSTLADRQKREIYNRRRVEANGPLTSQSAPPPAEFSAAACEQIKRQLREECDEFEKRLRKIQRQRGTATKRESWSQRYSRRVFGDQDDSEAEESSDDESGSFSERIGPFLAVLGGILLSVPMLAASCRSMDLSDAEVEE